MGFRLLIGSVVMGTTLANPTGLRHAPTPLAQLTPATVVSELTTTSSPPVIMQFVGRDKSVMVTAGPNGPLYTVTTVRGDVLVRSATLVQMDVQYPRLAEYVRAALASDASVGDSGP